MILLNVALVTWNTTDRTLCFLSYAFGNTFSKLNITHYLSVFVAWFRRELDLIFTNYRKLFLYLLTCKISDYKARNVGLLAWINYNKIFRILHSKQDQWSWIIPDVAPQMVTQVSQIISFAIFHLRVVVHRSKQHNFCAGIPSRKFRKVKVGQSNPTILTESLTRHLSSLRTYF